MCVNVSISSWHIMVKIASKLNYLSNNDLDIDPNHAHSDAYTHSPSFILFLNSSLPYSLKKTQVSSCSETILHILVFIRV